MKPNKNQSSRCITALLLITLSFSATLPLGAQETQPQRERRVSAPASSTTTTAPAPTPVVAPTPTAPSLSAPARTVPPAATDSLRTVEELQARISAVLRRSEIAPAWMAVKIASLDTGRVLYEEDGGSS